LGYMTLTLIMSRLPCYKTERVGSTILRQNG